MALLCAVLLCLASGFGLVRLGWPSAPLRGAHLLLQASLSIGFGLGIFSLTFFLALVFHVPHLLLIDTIVCALLLAIGLLPRRQTATAVLTSEKSPTHFPPWFHRFLTVSFLVAIAGALYAAIMRLRASPHGRWDSFAISNLHARFLFLGGDHWRDGFTTMLSWSRPDYPLLVPAAIAHFWTILGADAPIVPALIALVFTFATAGLLFSSLRILRGRAIAMLGSVALLATPAFVSEGASQYTDVPLSFFILATVALLCFRDATEGSSPPSLSGWLIPAGFSSAFAAWTKNEGLLFLAAIVAARFLILIPLKAVRERWISIGRETAIILLAALPILLVVAYFKFAIAPPDDVFADRATTLHRLLVPARYWIVFHWYAHEFLRFGEWLVPTTLTLAGLYFMIGLRKQAASGSTARTSALALLLTLAGSSVVYLITSYEIHWHLRFSLNRLFLQYWPAAIFLFFLSLRYGDQTRTTPQTTP